MPTFDQTQKLFDDAGFEEELRRRKKWKSYSSMVGTSIYPDQSKEEFRKQMLFKDLGFTSREYKDGRAELGMVKKFGLPANYDNAMLMGKMKEWVDGQKKDQDDFVDVFKQHLDEQFNQAPQKHYVDPRLNGLKQKAIAKTRNLNEAQKNFLNNVMKVATQDGFQFSSTASGKDVNTTLDGTPRMGILMDSWAQMSPNEKAHVRQYLPFVAEKAWEKVPEREADFGQMTLEAGQDVGEDLVGGLAFMGSAIADVTIRAALGTRHSDEDKHRWAEEEKLSAMLKQLRKERRGKIEKGTEFLGFDTASFKQMVAGTIGEMAGMGTGPLMAISKGQMFREQDLVENPTAGAGSNVLRSTMKGIIYYKAGRSQLKYMTPSKLGGASIKGTFAKNTLKRMTMEGIQEGVQDGVPLVIDQLASFADKHVSAPNWGNQLRDWGEAAPEAAVMFFLLGGLASGADIATEASRSGVVAEQTADADMLNFNGATREDAERIAGLESATERLAEFQKLQEEGKLDLDQEIDEDTVQRVREKLRKQMDDDSENAGPSMMRMPNGDIRIDFPDNTMEVVGDEEAAIETIENWRSKLKETIRETAQQNMDTKLGDLTRTEIERLQQDTGQTIDVLPEDQRSLRSLVDSGAIPAKIAENRIRDLATQQVASGEVDMDPDAYAQILLNDFASGSKTFPIQGQADPDAFISEDGVLNAAIALNPEADVETVWEESLENHAHAMLNGQHWDLGTLKGWLEEVEDQTGKKFISGDTRENLIEAFSFVGRSYATGEMKNLSAKLKNTFDALLDVLMTLIGISREIDKVRQQGAFNPELEANIRAGLGIDGGDFYSSLVTKAQNSQGLSSPATQSISVSEAASIANAAGVSETTKEEFYGRIWPDTLKQTGKFDKTTPQGMRKAANAMIDDMLDFMAERPEFLGYYNEDWAASRDILDRHYGGISDNDFAMYRFLVGIMSPSTPLNKNILESVSAFDWMQSGRDYDDAVRLYVGPKGNVKGAANILNPQGPTWVTKARNVKVAHKVMEKLGLDWAGLQQWMGQRSTHAEIVALRREMGFTDALPAKTMATLMVPSGELGLTAGQKESTFEREVLKMSRDKKATYPNGFFFGKKVGPYTLNSMGYPQYSTVDIWESRAIRSYLGEFDAEAGKLDLPKASEDLMFSRFIIAFKEEFRRRFPDIRADVTDLQALRWFYMIGQSNKAGFKRSEVETISAYTDKHTTTMGSLGFRGLAKGVGDGSALPATIALPAKTPGTFSLANRKKLFDTVKENPDGFTIDPRTGELLSTGWVVAPRKHTEMELPGMTEEDFYSFLDKWGRDFRVDDEAHFGGWLRKEDDTFVLDVVTTYEDGADAAKVAAENDQDAIFGMDEFEEVKADAYATRFPGFEKRNPKPKGVTNPAPNYKAPMVSETKWPGEDYEVTIERETVAGLKPNELVHFTGHHTLNIDRVKVSVAGSKGAEKKIYREYPELYTKRAYVAFNGYGVESQYGIMPDKGYKIEVHESHWYSETDPLDLYSIAKAKASALGLEGDKTATHELYLTEMRDAGFLGFKAASGKVGVILKDLDVIKGLPDPNPAAAAPTMSIIVSKDEAPGRLVEAIKSAESTAPIAQELLKLTKEWGEPIIDGKLAEGILNEILLDISRHGIERKFPKSRFRAGLHRKSMKAAWKDRKPIFDYLEENAQSLLIVLKTLPQDPEITFSISDLPGFRKLPSTRGDRFTANYAGGKGIVDFTIPAASNKVEIDMLHASDGTMAKGILNDLRQVFPDHSIVVSGITGGHATKFWGKMREEGRVDAPSQTFSITGKKKGKAVPKGMALLGIVDDNMRVKTKVTKHNVYHDQAFGSYASARSMSRFRVLDNKTIIFMEDPGPARDAINFELEYLGYEIKTVEGAGRSNWTFSISERQVPKWPGTKDGGRLAQWLDAVEEFDGKLDEFQPILFEDGDTHMFTLIRNIKKGKDWVIENRRMDDAAVIERTEFDTRVHALAQLAKDGHQMLDYFDFKTFSLNPGLRSLRDRVEAKAMEQDATGTSRGLDAYLKMLVNVERLIQRNDNRVSQPKSKKAQDRLSLTQDIAAYDAMLSALPPEVRARMGGWATLASKAKHETRVKFLKDRLPMIERHLERFLNKQYLEQVDQRFKKMKARTGENNVPQGRDADMHSRLDEMQAVMDMGAEEVANAETQTENALALTSDPSDIMELTDRLVMLQMFGGLRGKGEHARSAADVAEALAEVDNTINVGMTRYRAKEEQRLAENKKKRASIIDDISRGEGILDPSEAKRRAPNLKGLKGRAKDLAQQYFYGMTSWEWMLNWAMGRRQKALKNDNVRSLSRVVHKSTHAENRRNIAHTEVMTRKLAKIFGIKTKGGWRNKLSKKLEEMKEEQETGINKISLTSAEEVVKIPIGKARQILAGEASAEAFGLADHDMEMLQQMLDENDSRTRPRGDSHQLQIEQQRTGPTAEMRLSQDQAIYLYMMWKQQGAQRAMKRWGYTQEIMDKIFNFMTPEALEIEAWLRTQYDNNWHELNPVYRSRFGVNMARIKNYSPTSYIHMGKQEVEMLLEETTPGASVTPGFAKSRQRHHAQPREDVGALEAYTVHMRQSSHFISWAETVADLRQLLQHKDTQVALEQHGGRHLKGYINERIDFFADGGNRVKNLWILDAIRKKFTVLALSWNVGVMLKQLSSQPAFMFDNDPKVFLKYQAKFFRNPVANWKKMWAMPFVQERFSQGFDRDVMLAMSGKGGRDIFNWILETGMITGRTGDIIPVVIGGFTVYQSTYDAAIRRGVAPQVADAEAQVAFEMSVERAQQAGDIKDLSSFQQGGSVARIFTMFLTSPLQYYMNTYHAIANVKAEGGKQDLIKRIIISHIVLPWAFQFISDLAHSPQDEEDEDMINPADYVRAMFLGPLNGIFILGHGLTVGTGHATNAIIDLINGEDGQIEKTKVWGYSNPVVDMASESFEGSGDALGAVGEFISDPNLKSVKDTADGIGEAGKLYGPLGLYDVANRLVKSVGLMDEVDFTLLPSEQQLGQQIRDDKKAAYSLREDEYKAVLKALKEDKDDEDAKELKKEIQEERWEQLAYLLVQRLKNESQEDIEEAMETLPKNHIPASVKDIAFPELDYQEPEE